METLRYIVASLMGLTQDFFIDLSTLAGKARLAIMTDEMKQIERQAIRARRFKE